MSLALVRKTLEPLYDGFRHLDHYDEETELYTHTVRTTWETRQTRPYKGDTLSSSRRLYIHYYFNGEQAAEEEKTRRNHTAQHRYGTIGRNPRKRQTIGANVSAHQQAGRAGQSVGFALARQHELRRHCRSDGNNCLQRISKTDADKREAEGNGESV